MPMKGRAIPAEASEALRKRGLSVIARPGAPSVDEISFDENDALEAVAEDYSRAYPWKNLFATAHATLSG